MCEPISLAAASVAVSAGGAIAGFSASSKNAAAQAAYNRQVELNNRLHRIEVMDYQNQVWEQDIKHAGDTLAWAEREWDRQVRYADRAVDAIEKNTIAATGQLLLRQVEEDIAVVAQSLEVQRTGKQARAARRAVDRGVEGGSVDAIINDVTRQEGEALNVMAMNRSATTRAITRQIIEADAQGDQQLASLALKTYSPASQIRAPAPVSPVQPTAPVPQANVGQLVTGLAGAVTGGVNTYNALAGQTTADTFNQAGAWLKRQFTIG